MFIILIYYLKGEVHIYIIRYNMNTIYKDNVNTEINIYNKEIMNILFILSNTTTHRSTPTFLTPMTSIHYGKVDTDHS